MLPGPMPAGFPGGLLLVVVEHAVAVGVEVFDDLCATRLTRDGPLLLVELPVAVGVELLQETLATLAASRLAGGLDRLLLRVVDHAVAVGVELFEDLRVTCCTRGGPLLLIELSVAVGIETLEDLGAPRRSLSFAVDRLRERGY